MGKIVVLAPIPAEALAPQFEGHEVVSVGRDEDPAAACQGADVCVADWSAHHRVAGQVVEALASTCRLVQVPAAGLDSVDIEACAAAGVPVANAAGLNARAVAEWVVWGALSGLRGLVRSERALRAGDWDQLGRTRYDLTGRTVGIVGMGDVGEATAQLLTAFDVDLRYWTRERRPVDLERRLELAWMELDELIRGVEVLVLAVALTPDTTGLLSSGRIASMQPSAVVVNASRGAVADEEALAQALAQGRLHAVVTDVYGTEPPPADHPLLGLDAAVTTPHVAGTTAGSVSRILERSLTNVRAALEGGEVQGRVV